MTNNHADPRFVANVAKRIHVALGRDASGLSLSACRELVAKGFGHPTWHALGRAPSPAGKTGPVMTMDATTGPVLRGSVRSALTSARLPEAKVAEAVASVLGKVGNMPEVRISVPEEARSAFDDLLAHGGTVAVTLEGILGDPSSRDVQNSSLGQDDEDKPRLHLLRATADMRHLKGFGTESSDPGFPDVEVAVTGLAQGRDDRDRHVAIEGMVTARASHFGCYVVTPSRVLWQDVSCEASRLGHGDMLNDVIDRLFDDVVTRSLLNHAAITTGSVADVLPPRLDVIVDAADRTRIAALVAAFGRQGLETQVIDRHEDGIWAHAHWARFVRATAAERPPRGPVPTMPTGRPASNRAVPIPGGGPEWDREAIARRRKAGEESSARNDVLARSLFGTASGIS